MYKNSVDDRGVMGSYDSDKRVRAGSYQVDPIAKIVLKPKEKKPK